MNLFLRSGKRIVRGLTLLTVSLVLATSGAPPAHAGGATIQATDWYNNISVTGQGFNSIGGSVFVGAYDYTLGQWDAFGTTTPTVFHCTLSRCFPGGDISTWIRLTNYSLVCDRTVTVWAYDYTTQTWSNGVPVNVQCLP